MYKIKKNDDHSVVYSGRVLSGRGLARGQLAAFAKDIVRLTGSELYPGTLNVVLDWPLLLNDKNAIEFDKGRRLMWPATINGIQSWIYRWRHAPLHVVEMLSAHSLRSALGIEDRNKVSISVATSDVLSISPIAFAAWSAVWIGRRAWCYTNDDYYVRTRPLCRRLGATQERIGRSIMSLSSVKRVVRATPVIGAFAVKLLEKKPAHVPAAEYKFTRSCLSDLSDGELERAQVGNLLNYTKTSNSPYSAKGFPAGYHTLQVGGQKIEGQRDPAWRLSRIPENLDGKVVLDIGCNQGGMLHPLSARIKRGVGVDYDNRMVNVANRIRDVNGTPNLSFFVFDLEKEPLDLIADFLPGGRADVAFLLSVCMWIDNWKDVVKFVSFVSDALFFESNGTDEQQDQQVGYLSDCYGSIVMLAATSDDDLRQKKRRLFYATRPIR